jgi:hypothetical protein
MIETQRKVFLIFTITNLIEVTKMDNAVLALQVLGSSKSVSGRHTWTIICPAQQPKQPR